jgi:hypothetical protein
MLCIRLRTVFPVLAEPEAKAEPEVRVVLAALATVWFSETVAVIWAMLVPAAAAEATADAVVTAVVAAMDI